MQQQRERRRRRSSLAAGDGSVLTQLTRRLALTYAQCKPVVGAPVQDHHTDVAAAAVPSTTTTTTHHKPTRATVAPSHRRILTKKTRPSGNDGLDNEEQNLIVRVRDVLGGRDALPVQPEFVVLDLLGQGTFGQVFRCQHTATKELVAIKVIRNHPSYYKQAIVEVQITRLLNASYTADEAPHFVRMKDTFEFRNHLCIVFELLSINVYELISENNFNGFPLEVTRGFQQQILHALVRMDEIGVIHCDLKPENILLVGQDQFLSDVAYHNDPQMARLLATSEGISPGGATASSGRFAAGRTPYIKVVDFGSACMENETVYSYIQSRFYRSPEVLLGIPYTGAIDLWSLGCIAVEMFLGLPLFPGVSEHDQLRLIEETLGKLPQELLRKGRNVLKFYNVAADNRFVLKTPAEFAHDTNAEVQVSKKYFKYTKLEDMVHAYPYAKRATESQRRHERERREAFLHFVRGLLCVDPLLRWSARIAMRHPFITGVPFVREEVEYAQRAMAMPSPGLSPVACAVAPHHFEYAPQVTHAWPSPVPPLNEFGEVASTLTYDARIWGPSGMSPYASGRSHHHDHYPRSDEQLPRADGSYTSHRPQQQSQYHRGHGETTRSKVVPSTSSSSHLDVPSTRVFPYDPCGEDARLAKAYEASSPSGGYRATHSKVTPTQSLTSSRDGFPVVPMSPYESSQPDYDTARYYGSPHTTQHAIGRGGLEWPWPDTTYDMPPASSLGASSESHRNGPSWPQPSAPEMAWNEYERLPRHHQYMPEPLPHLPPRRGKRQHTNSWDNGDTRELRRHEAAYPQSHHGSRTGYAPPQQKFLSPSQRSVGSASSSVASSGSRTHGTPRKSDHHKGRSGGTTRHARKSPKGVAAKGHHHHHHHHHQKYQHPRVEQQPPLSLAHLHSQYVGSRDDVPPMSYQYEYHQQQHHHSHAPYASAPKRDESAGVCSVEEKFSSVMSLDLQTSAVT